MKIGVKQSLIISIIYVFLQTSCGFRKGDSSTPKPATHQMNIFKDVVWAEPNGLSLTMDIYVPETGKKTYPVLVIYHGGGWLINNNTIMNQMSQYIAEHADYIVCNVNYRLLGDDNNTIRMDQIIGDVFGALLWIKENISKYKGDSSKIAITGDSAGGHLSACIVNMGFNLSPEGLLSSNPGFLPTYLPSGKSIEAIIEENGIEVQAAIISYGAFNILASCTQGKFETKDNIFWSLAKCEPRGIFGDSINAIDNPEIYKSVSPIFHIPKTNERKLPPQLCTVGSEDNLTTPQSVKAYVDSLTNAGQPAEYWVHEGRPHAFLDSGSNEYLGINFEKDAPPAIDKMISFLDNIFYTNKE